MPFVGHFQTRNKGTVCGSIAHADPSSEIPLALAVLGGEVVLRSQKRGERVLAAAAFQQDMLTTARAPDELIAAVRFPVVDRARAPRSAKWRAATATSPSSRWRRSSRTDGAMRLGVGGMAGRPMVRKSRSTAAARTPQPPSTHGREELEGYEDLHASAALRRDLLRNLAPLVIEEAVRCAA